MEKLSALILAQRKIKEHFCSLQYMTMCFSRKLLIFNFFFYMKITALVYKIMMNRSFLAATTSFGTVIELIVFGSNEKIQQMVEE